MQRANKILLSALWVVLCLLCAGHAQDTVEDAPVSVGGDEAYVNATDLLMGAEIAWDGALPPAGSVVKVRVRGEILQHLLTPGSAWQLRSGILTVPSTLVPANLPETPEMVVLTHEIEERADGKSINVSIDLGENPAPLNRLAIRFAATSYLGKVKLFSSMNKQDYREAGQPQLVFQEVADGHVLRLGELKVDVGTNRYLRLSMPTPPGAGIHVIEGWFDPQPKLEVNKAQASLGSMIEGDQPGESVWPIYMDHDNLPIAKLKVLADSPGTVKLVHLATMDGANLGQQIGDGIAWAGQLEEDDLRLENKWITLTGEPQVGPWAIVVDDGEEMPLQLTGVEVYLLEHWLIFAMPEDAEPRLWQMAEDVQTGANSAMLPDRLESATMAGTLLDWNIEEPGAVLSVTAPSWINQPLEYAKSSGWQLRMFAYIGLACVFAVVGLILLRREKNISRQD